MPKPSRLVLVLLYNNVEMLKFTGMFQSISNHILGITKKVESTIAAERHTRKAIPRKWMLSLDFPATFIVQIT